MGYFRTEESTHFTLTFPHSSHTHICEGRLVRKVLCKCNDWMSPSCLFANIHTNRCLFKKGVCVYAAVIDTKSK